MFRSSPELRATEFIGHFHKSFGEALELNTCDSDYGFGIVLEIEELENNKTYCIQLVCLFTDYFGETYLRSINYNFKATDNMSKFFESIDVDAFVKLSAVREINNCIKSKSFDVKTKIKNKLIDHLYAYRDHCGNYQDLSQLLIPERTRYYILYTHCLLKKLPFTASSCLNSSAASTIEYILRAPLNRLVKYCYPTLYRVDDLHLDQTHKISYSGEKVPNDLGMLNKRTGTINKPNLEIPMVDMIEEKSKYIKRCVPVR